MESTFAKQFDLLRSAAYDNRTLFEDFLTMTIASFGRLPGKTIAEDEALYLEVMAKYKTDPIRFEFPNLLASLIMEMEQRRTSEEGWDVLGEWYEEHLGRKDLSQFFTPWPICKFMVAASHDNVESKDGPIRILDPSCGSGRMLMAGSQVFGPMAQYSAVDVDPTCVKMTALNLFLSGLFYTESMCGNPLLIGDFRFSYRTSFVPFGMFRITEKEKSHLWHSLNTATGTQSVPYEENASDKAGQEGSQLKFF